MTAFFACQDLPAEETDREQVAFFEARIRPALVEHCYECHSSKSKQPKGGLLLDSRHATQTGGESGPAVVPHHADQSLLIQAIRYESFEMPPRGRLPDSVIRDFVRWIELGAADPRERNAVSQTELSEHIDHWAFKPIMRPPVPAADPTSKYAEWATSGIDQFILRALQEHELSPNEDADRYTWLRRVSIDLTGVPPTPEEIEAFVTDRSLSAHETVVDRLISSHAFGERWARHWLDLVGYADQIGTSNSVFAEHAWRYRDYVIDAFNSDLPYDEFVREQIAGDLIAAALPSAGPQRRAAAAIATGFLVLGDVEIVEADKAKMRVDIVDQQVVKTSKAFLGLTVGCARCHDHKFDPISQREYYAMASFFYNTQSTYKTDRGVWSDVLQRELPETEAQRTARMRRDALHAEKLSGWKQSKVTLSAEIAELDEKVKTAVGEKKQQLVKLREEKQNRITTLGRQITHAEFFTPRPPRAYGVQDHDAFEEMRITIRGNPHALGDAVPRGFIEALTQGTSPEVAEGGSGRLQLADWITSDDNPLTARVAVNRIWQKFFGEGLVRSVDYFGVRGDRPTHPELLDYLAGSFSENGWSVKQLIRSIVLSRTYRLASSHDDACHESDPANRWLWRMNRRRLDAEALRDSLIAIGGQLQPCRGGDPLSLEYAENVGNLDPKDVNPPSFSLRRYRPELPSLRTIYLPVVRSTAQRGPAELRNVFDFPTPAQTVGKRPVTAVPTQALFLMNSAPVRQHASAVAAHSREMISESDACSPHCASLIRALWLLVLNRPPTTDETSEASVFLQNSSLDELCHALIATNEFLMTL